MKHNMESQHHTSSPLFAYEWDFDNVPDKELAACCHHLHSAYRQAFERLDRALSENSLSNDLEKIDEVRRTLFGRENIEVADRSAKAAEKTQEQLNS